MSKPRVFMPEQPDEEIEYAVEEFDSHYKTSRGGCPVTFYLRDGRVRTGNFIALKQSVHIQGGAWKEVTKPPEAELAALVEKVMEIDA